MGENLFSGQQPVCFCPTLRATSLLAAVVVGTRQRQAAPSIKDSYAIDVNGF